MARRMTILAQGRVRDAGSYVRAVHGASMMTILCAYLLSPAATAQVMSDPTRPPAELQSTETGDNTAAPVLQSVMISPAARTAIIGGQTVKLGGKFGDARVIRITENEVVLRSQSGTETLKLYPAVNITPVKPAPVPHARPGQKKKRAPPANTRGKQG